MGPIEQQIAKQHYMMRMPLPDRIQNAPVLISGLELYLHAFFDLDSERSHGMGVTKIPWSCIKDYALFYEFDSEQTSDLFYLIRKMDSEHVKSLAAKSNGTKP
jgi:hypothetical protein